MEVSTLKEAIAKLTLDTLPLDPLNILIFLIDTLKSLVQPNLQAIKVDELE